MRLNQSRFLAACLAALVSAVVGPPARADAQTECGLKDANAYLAALASPTVEATPAYLRATAEDFLQRCPTRHEAPAAHLVAARGALDSGDAHSAVAHYAAAEKAGARVSPSTRMDQAIALLAADQPLAAKAARNRAILDWLTGLDHKGSAQLSVQRLRNGSLYSVVFAKGASVEAVFLAVPSSADMPAAVIMREDRPRAAWQALRDGRAPQPLMITELQTCRTKTLLQDSSTGLDLPVAEKQAVRTLMTWLKTPEPLAATKPGAPLASCTGLGHLLFEPN